MLQTPGSPCRSRPPWSCRESTSWFLPDAGTPHNIAHTLPDLTQRAMIEAALDALE